MNVKKLRAWGEKQLEREGEGKGARETKVKPR